RGRLCTGQSGHAGALVRGRADDRPDHRAGRGLARPRARGHARDRAQGGAQHSRQAPFGDRLSGPGCAGRGEAHVSLAVSVARRSGSAGVMLVAAALTAFAAPAQATKIDRVVSPGGIEAWVVRERSPLIAVQLSFEGGSAQDPADKAGLAYLTADL